MTSGRGDEVDSEIFSDEELAELALRADPSPEIAPDAVPWNPWINDDAYALPDWYMPRGHAVRRGRTTKTVVICLIAGFLVIDAFGLCITSGFLTFA